MLECSTSGSTLVASSSPLGIGTETQCGDGSLLNVSLELGDEHPLASELTSDLLVYCTICQLVVARLLFGDLHSMWLIQAEVITFGQFQQGIKAQLVA